jgi:hypothetical protein
LNGRLQKKKVSENGNNNGETTGKIGEDDVEVDEDKDP